MDRSISNNIVRFLLLWFAQVFIFKQLFWEWNGQVYLQVHICVLFILLLPFKIPRILTLFLAFVLGIAIDFFYESYGIFAASLVFTAYVRAMVLKILTPREGYGIKDSPTKMSLGDAWFFKYTGLLLLLHFLFYYSIESFTFVYMNAILLKTFFSWIGSMFFILIIVYVTNPKA